MSDQTTDIDPTLPEAVRSFLERGHKLESIRLDAYGRWWHRGNRFENPRIRDLFSRSIGRTDGGTWVLEIGRFTYPIEVEDTPFFVHDWNLVDGVIRIDLSDKTTETLALESLRYSERLGLSCRVRGGRFRARFAKAPYYRFCELIEPTANGDFVVHVGDQHVTIPPEEPDSP